MSFMMQTLGWKAPEETELINSSHHVTVFFRLSQSRFVIRINVEGGLS